MRSLPLGFGGDCGIVDPVTEHRRACRIRGGYNMGRGGCKVTDICLPGELCLLFS